MINASIFFHYFIKQKNLKHFFFFIRFGLFNKIYWQKRRHRVPLLQFPFYLSDFFLVWCSWSPLLLCDWFTVTLLSAVFVPQNIGTCYKFFFLSFFFSYLCFFSFLPTARCSRRVGQSIDSFLRSRKLLRVNSASMAPPIFELPCPFLPRIRRREGVGEKKENCFTCKRFSSALAKFKDEKRKKERKASYTRLHSGMCLWL